MILVFCVRGAFSGQGTQVESGISRRDGSSTFAPSCGGKGVLNRGDRFEPIFQDDVDRQGRLATLSEACAKTGWQLHAWCLLVNPFSSLCRDPLARSRRRHEAALRRICKRPARDGRGRAWNVRWARRESCGTGRRVRGKLESRRIPLGGGFAEVIERALSYPCPFSGRGC